MSNGHRASSYSPGTAFFSQVLKYLNLKSLSSSGYEDDRDSLSMRR
ncbi:1840_t:CDS:1, partial [Gigaspora margarita]